MIAYIRLRSFDPNCLYEAWKKLARPDARWVGLPTHKKLYTLLRSPHVHKTARDQYYFHVKNAVCTLPNPQSWELMQCFDIPGVSCTIRLEGRSSFPSFTDEKEKKEEKDERNKRDEREMRETLARP